MEGRARETHGTSWVSVSTFLIRLILEEENKGERKESSFG